MPYQTTDTHELQTHQPPYISTSDLIAGILQDLDTEKVLVGALAESLEHRSFGGLIILLSIIGLLPGISVFCGMAILLLAVQMSLGYRVPKLPNFLVKREIDVDKLRSIMRKPLHYIAKLEKIIKPRITLLTTPRAIRAIGVIAALLALVMITPLPLSNLLPAIALLLISVGILESDGVLVLAGLLASLFAMTIGFGMVGIIYSATLGLFGSP